MSKCLCHKLKKTLENLTWFWIEKLSDLKLIWQINQKVNLLLEFLVHVTWIAQYFRQVRNWLDDFIGTWYIKKLYRGNNSNCDNSSKIRFLMKLGRTWFWVYKNVWLYDLCFYQYFILAMYKKWGFPLRVSSVNVTRSAWTADLVTFTEEFLNRRFLFFAQCRGFSK